MEVGLQTTKETMKMGREMRALTNLHTDVGDEHRQPRLPLPDEVNKGVEVLLQGLVMLMSPALDQKQTKRAK